MDIIDQEMKRRNHAHSKVVRSISGPPFYFTVQLDKKRKAQLFKNELETLLPQITDETLIGFLKQINAAFYL